jgi:ATP-binding cassette subfamily C protein
MKDLLRKALRMLPPATRPRWLLLLPLMLASAVAEAAGAAGVFYLVQIVNEPGRALSLPVFSTVAHRLGLAEPRSILTGFTLALTAFYVCKNLLALLTEHVRATCVGRSTSTVARSLLRGYLAAPYSFHFRRNSAELIRNAHESVERVFGLAVSHTVGTLIETLIIVAIGAVLIVAAPSVTLTAGGVLLLVSYAFLRATRKVAVRLSVETQGRSGEALRHLQQALHAIKEIKVLGREKFFDQAFGEAEVGLARARYVGSILNVLPRLVVETVFIAGALLVMILLVSSGGGPADSLSLLGLYAYAGFRIIPSVNRILWHWNLVRSGSRSVDDVYEDYIRFRDAGVLDASAATSVPRFSDTFELRNVSYRYAEGAPPALRGIDLVIHRGESVGIVGRTGAGKSTLLDIIVGLLQPTGGDVLIDGEPLGGNVRGWQRQIGYVPQVVYLTDASLRANIALGVAPEEIDDEAVGRAVSMAQLDAFVAELPAGMDTIVGERGIRLSGGQRQRVAIARALYHQPEVLVFDEATSALDMETERRLSEAVLALHGVKTLVLVAHRLATVEHCDRLFFLADGRVAGCGSYSDLLRDNREFRAMV